MGWEPIARGDERESLLKLIESPGDGNKLYAKTIELYGSALDSVKTMEIVYRKKVSPTRPLTYLRPASQKAYAQQIGLFVLFLSRWENVTDDVREKLTIYEENPSQFSLFQLLLECICQLVPNTRTHGTCLTHFLFASTHCGDGSMMLGDQIGQLCAKIKYMIKLTCLVMLSYVFICHFVFSYELVRLGGPKSWKS